MISYHGITLQAGNRRNERTINVRNRSGQKASYYLINVGSSIGDFDSGDNMNDPALGVPQRCVYQATKLIPSPNGSWAFRIEDCFIAVCGSGQGALVPGNTIVTNDASNVQAATPSIPGSRLRMTVLANSTAAFDVQATDMNTFKVLGAFGVQIGTGADYTDPDNAFVGFGAEDPKDVNDDEEVLPLVIWNAQPGATYTMKCEQKWMVCCASAVVGEIVDHRAINLRSPVINFGTHLNDNQKTAKVTHTAEGVFLVEYS